MFSHEIKIPKERVAVLIGPKGKTKNELQDNADCKIDVDSKEGDVLIEGEDALKLYAIKEVIHAIGRGFNPEIAQLLLKQDYSLVLVNVMDYVKDRKNHLERVRARVIGTGGKARTTIETMTETNICVYGKTVGIIGTAERVGVARHAVESLLNGAPHGHVYHNLEAACIDLKQREMLS